MKTKNTNISNLILVVNKISTNFYDIKEYITDYLENNCDVDIIILTRDDNIANRYFIKLQEDINQISDIIQIDDLETQLDDIISFFDDSDSFLIVTDETITKSDFGEFRNEITSIFED